MAGWRGRETGHSWKDRVKCHPQITQIIQIFLILFANLTNDYPTNDYLTNRLTTNDYPTNDYPTNDYPTNDYPTNHYSTNDYPTARLTTT